VDAGVLSGVKFTRVVGVEGPRVGDLTALDVGDAKATARLDPGRASFARRNVDTLGDQAIILRPRLGRVGA
jgi:hypothetical protein